jgi:hypothetical protein
MPGDRPLKAHYCSRCSNRVFFENTTCTHCNAALGFVPLEGIVSFEIPPAAPMAKSSDASADASTEANAVASADAPVDALAATSPTPATWTRLGPAADNAPALRPCHNYAVEGVCNWMVPADDPNPLCRSCRLTRVIPSLAVPGHREHWARLELAKRRLVYALLERGLPLTPKSVDAASGLAFEFLADQPAAPHVVTGHDAGVITLNIAEADDAVREKTRLAMHEPYRTLLGHFRHESGHYFWDRLVDGTPLLDEFRTLFGDERADYGEALKRHYAEPVADWVDHYVSSYASSHPWEDWAETWAHYWHIEDGLETAAAWGLALGGVSREQPGVLTPQPLPLGDEDIAQRIVEQWLPVSQFVNAMDRSLGTLDSYPFVLSPEVLRKLSFVGKVVSTGRMAQASLSSSEALETSATAATASTTSTTPTTAAAPTSATAAAAA